LQTSCHKLISTYATHTENLDPLLFAVIFITFFDVSVYTKVKRNCGISMWLIMACYLEGAFYGSVGRRGIELFGKKFRPELIKPASLFVLTTSFAYLKFVGSFALSPYAYVI
jgi:hypothetical protein